MTKLLQKLEIPLLFLTPDAASHDRLRARLDALAPEAMAQLSAAGAVLWQPGDGFVANWITHVSYYWEMTFPANGALEVRHAYTPVPEAFIFGRYDLETGPLRDEVCMTAPFAPQSRRALAMRNHRQFPVRCDRAFSPDRRQGQPGHAGFAVPGRDCQDRATTFEWWAENWAPKRDLSLLFLAPPR